MGMFYTIFFVLVLCCTAASFVSHKDKLRAEAETKRMPDNVKKTIKGTCFDVLFTTFEDVMCFEWMLKKPKL